MLGLSLLLVFVTVFSGTLVVARERQPRIPESPMPRDLNQNRDLSSADTSNYPPSRYEDIKGYNDTSMNAVDMSTQFGVGGVPVQGQLFPPLRSTANDKPKFPQNAGPKVAGKFTISQPIPVDSPDMQNSLNKIPTVDLKTAFKNDKERRAADERRRSALVASRPAPQPPDEPSFREQEEAASINSQEDEVREIRAPAPPPFPLSRSFTTPANELTRADSMKITDLARSNTTKTAKTGGELSVEANASSTSAQLSPGNEALRRRSPRQVMPTKTPTKTSTNFQPITPGQPVRIPIPRPPPPPQTQLPEPVKTPLQRRPTTGLPGNPRARARKGSGDGDQQTVMFVNSIVYDDPNVVNDIIQSAVKPPALKSAVESPLESSKSVVHRGRPIPRKNENDRLIFPAEVSAQGHRRSRSSGSLVALRKSILQSQPGTPSELPPLPLPPPPKSAGAAQRPQPNDTKSMTFVEKMNYLYNESAVSSPSGTTSGAKRRSSVPALPTLPPTFLNNSSQEDREQGGYVAEDDEKRRTKTTVTDRSSVMTDEIFNGLPDNLRNTTQSRSAAEDVGTSSLPGTAPENERVPQRSFDGLKRQSSPVIPAVRYSAKTKDDDATTNWSVHSPIAPVNMQQLNARTTYVGKDNALKVNTRIPSNISGYGGEVMTVMLDTSSEHTFDTPVDALDSRSSFYLSDDENEEVGVFRKEAGRRDRGKCRPLHHYC